jgi:hypothetical protein
MSKIFKSNDITEDIVILDQLVMFWKESNHKIALKFTGSRNVGQLDDFLIYCTQEDRDADYQRLALIIDLQEG